MDDNSHYTWTLFLSYKRYMFASFNKLASIIHNENALISASIQSYQDYDF